MLRKNKERLIKVSLQDEGWGKEMYGHFGILPPESHKIVSKYTAKDIKIYKDYDLFTIDISESDFDLLSDMHNKIQFKRNITL